MALQKLNIILLVAIPPVYNATCNITKYYSINSFDLIRREKVFRFIVDVLNRRTKE